MTFNIVWCSFWSGVAGGILGYYACARLQRVLIRRAQRRAQVRFELAEACRPSIYGVRGSHFSRHTGFDHDD